MYVPQIQELSICYICFKPVHVHYEPSKHPLLTQYHIGMWIIVENTSKQPYYLMDLIQNDLKMFKRTQTEALTRHVYRDMCLMNISIIPVEVHLVYLWVIRLNAFLLLVEEIGEIGKRRLHWEHFGKVVDFRANLIQHSLHSYTSIQRAGEQVRACFLDQTKVF